MVTRGWNGYRNKSQHRKSTLEKKILPPFQQGFEPETFQSQVRCSNHRAIPAPRWEIYSTHLFISVIQAGWIQKYLQIDYFYDSLFYDSSQIYSEIFTRRLHLDYSVIPVRWIQKYSQRDHFSDSVLWFKSDEFRNIHKETTFRTLCSVTTVRWIQKYSQTIFRTLFCDSSHISSEIFTKRLLFRLCSVIRIRWIQKYSQRDYF